MRPPQYHTLKLGLWGYIARRTVGADASTNHQKARSSFRSIVRAYRTLLPAPVGTCSGPPLLVLQVPQAFVRQDMRKEGEGEEEVEVSGAGEKGGHAPPLDYALLLLFPSRMRHA